ncbi:MAG: sigma-70 family RNA polymerase sigma factor [Nocardioides sp.]|nr:sigma-70 family RNA polymerase sigma factor [Nocardioides sp.]
MEPSADEQAFKEFFVARSAAMRRTAYVMVGDWQVAEDLTQQAMVKIHATWRKRDIVTRGAYAQRILINECLSYLRKRRPEIPVTDVPDTAIHVDVSGGLEPYLRELTPRQRAVIALRLGEDLAVHDVADLLSMAPSTVKSHTARALSTIRRGLEAAIEGPRS